MTRYFGAQPTDRVTAWRQVAIFMGHHQMRGYTSAPIIERTSGRLIGRGGLWQPEGWPGLEVGWILEPGSWGRGYASELGRASRDYAFSTLGADHLISLIVPDNEPSIRVAQAIGSRHEGQTTLNGDKHLIYGQSNPAPAAAAR